MADNTFGQAESEMWIFQRQCRITSSNCKDVICLKNGHTGLIKRLLWASSPVTSAILYGQENESKALEQYKKTQILMLKKLDCGSVLPIHN